MRVSLKDPSTAALNPSTDFLTITHQLPPCLTLYSLFPGSVFTCYMNPITIKDSLQLLNSTLENLRQILMSGKGLVKWGPDKFVFRTKCKLRWKLRMRILGHIDGGFSQVSLHLYGGLGQATKMKGRRRQGAMLRITG